MPFIIPASAPAPEYLVETGTGPSGPLKQLTDSSRMWNVVNGTLSRDGSGHIFSPSPVTDDVLGNAAIVQASSPNGTLMLQPISFGGATAIFRYRNKANFIRTRIIEAETGWQLRFVVVRNNQQLITTSVIVSLTARPELILIKLTGTQIRIFDPAVSPSSAIITRTYDGLVHETRHGFSLIHPGDTAHGVDQWEFMPASLGTLGV